MEIGPHCISCKIFELSMPFKKCHSKGLLYWNLYGGIIGGQIENEVGIITEPCRSLRMFLITKMKSSRRMTAPCQTPVWIEKPTVSLFLIRIQLSKVTHKSS